jgi:erythronate-4-phosphate dehydrogenase
MYSADLKTALLRWTLILNWSSNNPSLDQMLRIIADEKIPFLKGILEPYAKVGYLPARLINNRALARADCLVTRTRTLCNEQLLENTGVSFIATATIGYEHIDTEYCHKKGIKWANAPGCNASSVNQYVAAALAQYSTEKSFSLQEKKIGIIGVGHIGSLVANTAKQMGLVPLLNDPPREETEGKGEFMPLDLVLSKADIISLHVPLNDQGSHRTWHLANQKFFEKLKKPVLLINTSRGPVADTKALTWALKHGMVSDAILDVWENEPLIPSRLLSDVFIGTPHIAGYSIEGKALGTAMAVRAISKHFGLGLDSWYPERLPGPEERVIKLAFERDPENDINEAILRTYPIALDSTKLKRSPTDFEAQRNNYPVRREFGHYQVDPSGSISQELSMRLRSLGFEIH